MSLQGLTQRTLHLNGGGIDWLKLERQMPHPTCGQGSTFPTAHSFDQALGAVGTALQFRSTTQEPITATATMAEDGFTPTITFNGVNSRHGNVCAACWGFRQNCSGTRIGHCVEALDAVLSGRSWETYEQVAAFLLTLFAAEFGVDFFEGKQGVPGEAGNEWEIDAKGVRTSDGGFVIVECKRWKSKVPQETIAGLAFRITDSGAIGGIVVSPLGLQAGAKKVAENQGIFQVKLDARSTRQHFAMEFLDKFRVGAGLDMFLKGADVPDLKGGGLFIKGE